LIDETQTGTAKYDRLARRRRTIYRDSAAIRARPAKSGGECSLSASKLTRDQAEALAISALGFVAGDPQLLPRFLAITGIEAARIRRAAREPGFLAGVLRFVLAHEPTLMRFAAETGADPGSVAAALRALPLGEDPAEGSTWENP
jgi:hypothetical protein